MNITEQSFQVFRNYDPGEIAKQAREHAKEHGFGYAMKSWRFLVGSDGTVKVKIILKDHKGKSMGFTMMEMQ
jgi:hypothetical protein